MQASASSHIRSHIFGYAAIFFVLTSTAYATHPGGADTISSTDIIDGEVRTADVANDSVRSIKILNGSVFGVDLADGSVSSRKIADGQVTNDDLRANSVTRSKVLDETLTGADVIDSSLGGGVIGDDSVTGDDVLESSLAQVPSALLGGFGRTGPEVNNCDPETTTFETCASTPVLNVPPGARALILARVSAVPEIDADRGFGQCFLRTSRTGAVANTTVTIEVFDDSNLDEHATLVGITGPLSAGTTSFGIACNQLGPAGAITYLESAASVVLITAS